MVGRRMYWNLAVGRNGIEHKAGCLVTLELVVPHTIRDHTTHPIAHYHTLCRRTVSVEQGSTDYTVVFRVPSCRPGCRRFLSDKSAEQRGEDFMWSHTAKRIGHRFLLGEHMDYFHTSCHQQGYDKTDIKPFHYTVYLYSARNATPSHITHDMKFTPLTLS